MRTISLITIFLMASLSSILFAQDCNNPLLTFYGLPSTGNPQSGAGLQFCSNLQGGQTCCSPETIATFQNRANALIDRINNYDAAKDLYLAQLRNRYYDRFTDLLEDANDRADVLQRIRAANATIADQLQRDINASAIASNARNIANRFGDALSGYQAARNNCLTLATQVQASSWCLACDANYRIQGVAPDGTVTFSDGLCQALSDACLPFFTADAAFNALIRLRQGYWRLAAAAKYLSNYSNTNQVTPYIIPPDPYNPLSTQRAEAVPPDYMGSNEETSGSGQCTELWSGNPLLAQLLAIGNPGSASSEPSNENENVVIVVNNEDDSGARFLQDVLAGPEGIWAPNYLGTGLTFTQIRIDPGDYFGVRRAYESFGGLPLTEQGEDLGEDNGEVIVIINND